MKVVLQTGDKAPKLIADHVISEPDLDDGGVYVFIIDKKLVKVGSAAQMRKGIRMELAGFSAKIIKPKTNVDIFCLEETEDKESRAKARAKWIKFFQQKAPPSMLLNNTKLRKSPLKFEFDPRHNRWSQNLACILTLQSPKLKRHTINAMDLYKLDEANERFKTYFAILDQLHEAGWFTIGMSYFEPKTAPKHNSKGFLKEAAKHFK